MVRAAIRFKWDEEEIFEYGFMTFQSVTFRSFQAILSFLVEIILIFVEIVPSIKICSV